MSKLTRERRLRKERRLGIVPVDIEVMAQHLLTPAYGIEVVGLPIDAVYMSAFYAPERAGLQMVYGHESFGRIKEGYQLPILDVIYSEYPLSESPKPKSTDKTK